VVSLRGANAEAVIRRLNPVWPPAVRWRSSRPATAPTRASRPDPARQRLRHRPVPVPRVRHQRRLGHRCIHLRRPHRVAAATRPTSRVEGMRAQSVALPVPAGPRPPHQRQPPTAPPVPSDLALGERDRRRVHRYPRTHRDPGPDLKPRPSLVRPRPAPPGNPPRSATRSSGMPTDRTSPTSARPSPCCPVSRPHERPRLGVVLGGRPWKRLRTTAASDDRHCRVGRCHPMVLGRLSGSNMTCVAVASCPGVRSEAGGRDPRRRNPSRVGSCTWRAFRTGTEGTGTRRPRGRQKFRSAATVTSKKELQGHGSGHSAVRGLRSRRWGWAAWGSASRSAPPRTGRRWSTSCERPSSTA